MHHIAFKSRSTSWTDGLRTPRPNWSALDTKLTHQPTYTLSRAPTAAIKFLNYRRLLLTVIAIDSVFTRCSTIASPYHSITIFRSSSLVPINVLAETSAQCLCILDLRCSPINPLLYFHISCVGSVKHFIEPFTIFLNHYPLTIILSILGI